MKYIKEQRELKPNSPIYLFGYSAGGDAAIKLSKKLAKKKINVQGLVTFDPHSPTLIYGYDSYKLADNVQQVLNFYQRNELKLGSNPFLGGTIEYADGATDPNIDVSKTSVHVNVFRNAMRDYKNEIYSVLGL